MSSKTMSFEPNVFEIKGQKGYLCDDLIDEIFRRLPVKFLLRFRSLSKSWRARIGSPTFIHLYRLRSMKSSWQRKVLIRLIDNSREDDFNDLYGLHSLDQLALSHDENISIDISTLFPFDNPRVVNSCNGILCLVESNRRIILWNPSIRRKLNIPDHPYSGDDDKRPFIAAGLGFDPITNDYKIVSISGLQNKGNEKNSFIYSMKTRSWCPIASPTTPFYKIRSTACFVNGILHWVAYYHIPGSPYHYIMTFNLSTNVFGKISLPEPNLVTIEPTIIGGCLAVISKKSDYDYSIWVMKEYNNAASWSVLFKVQTLSDDDGGLKKVLQITTNNYFLINTYLAGLKVYDIATRVHVRLLDRTYDEIDMQMCIETLELLDSGEVDL